ncbi:MAG: alpha/beta fold hydrolase [Burkholderiaceae bacterium]|nr:alpha/beta fold hydrolase [Burkholderiaceae bacterium]
MSRSTPVPEHISSQGSSYTLQGQGTTLIFIHAVGMNKSIWLAQTIPLARHYQVLAYDILGHGRSTLPPEHPRLCDYARQLAELMNELGIYQAHLVGHSLGAMIALEFALSHPKRCLSVSALCPVFERSAAQRRAAMARVQTRSDIGGQAALTATLARWFNHPMSGHDLAAAKWIRQALDEVHPVGFRRSYELFAHCDAAHAERLGALRVPTLFMTGELDPNSTPRMAHAMARLVPGSTVRVLPQGRHMMCLSHADSVNAHLQHFFRSQGRASEVSPQALQQLLGPQRHGVAVIGVPDAGHQVQALNATDFALVSQTPLMLMVSIVKAAPSHLVLRTCEDFILHLFERMPTLPTQAVPPLGSKGWIGCTLVQALDYGDHAQLICEVRSLGSGAHQNAAQVGSRPR